jgi:hypothetical protein
MSILSGWEVAAGLYTATYVVARPNYVRLPKDQIQYYKQINGQIILLFGGCTM